MANTHEQFAVFHDKIELHNSKEQNLQRARDAIRDLIRGAFREKKRTPVPEFCAQGSFSMRTTVNPIDGEYDLDDGVYLQNLSKDDQTQWPTPAEVHKWLIDAVDGHTEQKPEDKTSCVRVVYAGQYHVDLPIYADLNGKNMHAETGDHGWHVSDPVEITKWFQGQIKQHGEQLRRIVRYLKAWADYQSPSGKVANSLILTVMAAQFFRSADDRDDSSLANTVAAIRIATLGGVRVLNPVDATEDIASRLSADDKKHFQTMLANLSSHAQSAIAAQTISDASSLWRKQFGERYPIMTPQEEADRQKKADAARLASVYAVHSPKPWGLAV